jgi:outer membrane immunogenic protein
MKKALLAGAALAALTIGALPAAAADLATRPVYKAPVAVPVAYNWSGFYIGGHVGYGWGEKDWDQTFTTPGFGAAFPNRSTSNVDGFLGGGQVGINWQSGMWVFGLEGDFSWTDADGCGRQSISPGFNNCTSVNWYATATGRLGVAFDRSLLYVKGGAAFVDEDHFVANTVFPTGGATSTSNTRTGWTVGGGLEYALWDNWSAKIEYNFMDFGTDNRAFTYTGINAGLTERYDIDQQVHVVKFGVNYRFNWGAPIVAKY